MTKFAVYRKLDAIQSVKSAMNIVAVVESNSFDEAILRYKESYGLPRAFTPLGKSGKYWADGWFVSIRKASLYEIDYFRVIRGPLTQSNANTAIPDLPIVYQGLPQTIAQWVKSMNLKWIQDSNTLFGGYYCDTNGDCYLPSSI